MLYKQPHSSAAVSKRPGAVQEIQVKNSSQTRRRQRAEPLKGTESRKSEHGWHNTEIFYSQTSHEYGTDLLNKLKVSQSQ
ncbi:hypothetical protein KOW79_001337 [Hemibagrus wyckioides]|uniref:Uncharacterized protein n=1 Tax=Hemibagrus wyckioides TaxID=337641 RepID=A0A9D3P625_9TELE|nr:hypothetical protein KOW79_001337 [Hemibagrus wyckioides]